MAKTLVNQTVCSLYVGTSAFCRDNRRFENFQSGIIKYYLDKNAKFLVNFNKNELHIRDRKKVYV